MGTTILIEKVKELIGDRKVIAAVFYTFNFDAKFFENYICPIFVPDVEFSDNELQNTILWKKYQSELPPIAVFCDENMKGNQGPSLEYDVFPIFIKGHCFHPKHSFILCDDDSLIFLTGSNNLTVSGWCRNVEGVYFQHFKKRGLKKEFPKEFLKDIRKYLEYSLNTWADNISLKNESLEAVTKFLPQRNNDKRNNKQINIYFTSQNKTFWEFLNDLQKNYNFNIPFSEIEIIAPYLSKKEHFAKFVKETACNNIRIAIPFEGNDLVGMEKELFKEIDESQEYRWHHYQPKDNSKQFRFCHAKLYRLWGNKKVITIVGSVNFTDAAFKGKGGNVESAVAYVSNISEEKELLNVSYKKNKNFLFTKSSLEQEEEDARNKVKPFDLEFTMNWSKRELSYKNRNPSKGKLYKGKVILDGKKEELLEINIKSSTKKSKTLGLNNDQFKAILNSNHVLKVQDDKTKNIYTYFLNQKDIEYRPLPEKYNISESELFKLWTLLNEEGNAKKISRLIERFIANQENEYGEPIKTINTQESILNKTGQHINGLLNLYNKLIGSSETFWLYYLKSDNIDTIIGYVSMLKSIYSKNEIDIGYYWFLLNFIELKFYNGWEGKQPALPKILKQEIKNANNEMEHKLGIDKQKLNWLKKQINE